MLRIARMADAIRRMWEMKPIGDIRHQLDKRPSSSLSPPSGKSPRVAVLYQALDPPLISGVRKPKKPGGPYHHNNSRL